MNVVIQDPSSRGLITINSVIPVATGPAEWFSIGGKSWSTYDSWPTR